MSVAAAPECMPASMSAHAGGLFGPFGEGVAALLRAVAIVAEGEDVEVPVRPTGVGAGTAVDTPREIATTLAIGREPISLSARDRGLDHGNANRGVSPGRSAKFT